jgi:hypothetical protein
MGGGGGGGARICPNTTTATLSNNSGMPVFKPSLTIADKIKPKTVLKRLRTMVKNKKRSTL